MLRREFFANIPKPADLGGRLQGDSGVLVEVTGSVAGTRVLHSLHTVMNHQEAYRLHGTTATAYLTGTGGAAGALLLASGQVRQAGVLAPECLDPVPLLRWIEENGVKVTERVRATAMR